MSREKEQPQGLRAGLDTLERLVLIHLSNRFVWLTVALSLVLILQLSFMQSRFRRFDTLSLMSHIGVAIEAGLLAAALICALATPRVRRAWYGGTGVPAGEKGSESPPQRAAPPRFSYLLSALAGNLTVTLALLVLLIPVLWLHRYPELQAIEIPIRVPLMMLQRGALVLAAVLVTHNIALILRYYLRLAWWLVALLAVAFHVALGYGITYLSYTTELFGRLNDVFYYNQLWHYTDALPVGWLQRSDVFHNIEQPYLGYYFSALLIWAATLLLLAPQAQRMTERDKPQS